MQDIAPPYKFHPEQIQYAQHVEEIARNGGLLLIEAGSGFGKTIANLVGGLRGFDKQRGKIVYLSRTEQQSYQVLAEIRQLNKTNISSQISAVQMASRKRLCRVPHVQEAEPESAGRLCKECQQRRAESKGAKYPECRPLPSSVTDTELVISVRDLDDWAISHTACGYLTGRNLLATRRVVACNYFYFLSKEIREVVGLGQTQDSLLVFDEGHNLETACCAVYEDSVTMKALIQAQKELQIAHSEGLLTSTPLLGTFDTLLKRYDALEKNTKRNQQQLPFSRWKALFATQGIDSIKARALEKEIEAAESEIFAAWERKNQEPLVGGLATLRIWRLYADLLERPTDFLTYFDRVHDPPRVVFQCLNPKPIFQAALSKAHNAVICSATLAPIPTQKQILGITDAKCVELGGIAKPENVMVLSCGVGVNNRELCLKLRFREANPWVIEEYALSIKRLLDGIQGGSLVLFPSHSLLQQISNMLKTLRPKARLFLESRDTREFVKTLEAYEDEVWTNGQAILAGIFRGRFAEGADLPNELSRAVIICGIPFARLSDPFIRAKRFYYEQQEQGAWQEWYEMNAYRLVAQALGRGWRNRHDFAVGLLLDSRYQQGRFTRFLPYWLRIRTRSVDSFDTTMRKAQEFLDQRNRRMEAKLPVEPPIRPKPRIRLRDQPSMCQICKGEILNEESLQLCPSCQTPFHLVHLAEWVKIRGTCPVCRAGLVVE